MSGAARLPAKSILDEVQLKQRSTGAEPPDDSSLPERERESLSRALRSRPAGSDPLTVTDYLYLGQLLPLKGKLNVAVSAIAPVRNDIAHVREIDRERLLRATLAVSDIRQAISEQVK